MILNIYIWQKSKNWRNQWGGEGYSEWLKVVLMLWKYGRALNQWKIIWFGQKQPRNLHGGGLTKNGIYLYIDIYNATKASKTDLTCYKYRLHSSSLENKIQLKETFRVRWEKHELLSQIKQRNI